ncbi:MAG: aldo/keto reductase [Oscillospiraceae bacterium]|jgi:L-glyceraldehyde 3-phosphate reductase|nr:aldo/keto reductase [Oscillospiraceae bacterium]
MSYTANSGRYDGMTYRRSGKSGLKLPVVSLGFWHNFGEDADFEVCTDIVTSAFDLGVTHFDLANNYGPPHGSAEETFGKIYKNNLVPYRDEIIISTKAGYGMWEGPYGDFGSKKYLTSSLDQSLRRMGLEYVDIFYHHRPDPETPVEETMDALAHAVRQGKALYVGLSNYSAEQAEKAVEVLRSMGVRCLIHQHKYSMMTRTPEDGLLDVLEENGVGAIAYSPLEQGILTNKYINGIPKDSRIASSSIFLTESSLTEAKMKAVTALNELAQSRNQTLAQLALSWVLREERSTSVIIGARTVAQMKDCVGAADNLTFTSDELSLIDGILASCRESR